MKIVVCDIDATITNDDVINTINKFINRGNLFIVATDKAINYIADTLSLINLDVEYYICNDGAVIFDKYYNVLYRKDIKQGLVRPIINMLDDDDNILETFVDTSHGFVKDTTKSANGIVARPYDRLKAEILLNSISLKYPNIHGYVNDNLLNIIDIDVNKCSALNYILDNYRLNKSDIIILGKDVTDLELMENYEGYNFKNCCEDIKKYSNGEVNDIKEFIENLLKEEETLDAIYA